MVNCEAVEILSYLNGLARSAGFELPDLGLTNASIGSLKMIRRGLLARACAFGSVAVLPAETDLGSPQRAGTRRRLGGVRGSWIGRFRSGEQLRAIGRPHHRSIGGGDYSDVSPTHGVLPDGARHRLEVRGSAGTVPPARVLTFSNCQRAAG